MKRFYKKDIRKWADSLAQQWCEALYVLDDSRLIRSDSDNVYVVNSDDWVSLVNKMIKRANKSKFTADEAHDAREDIIYNALVASSKCLKYV